MLNNSSEGSKKVDDDISPKHAEKKHDEALTSNAQSDFIPFDKDGASVKVPIRSHDRVQHKSYHHRTYYNSNRYQSRNGSNTFCHSTHTDYTVNSTNNSHRISSVEPNYNRTKRKRDSSAISAHKGNGKNQSQRGNSVKTTPTATSGYKTPCNSFNSSSSKENQSKYNLKSKPQHSVSRQNEVQGAVKEPEIVCLKTKCSANSAHRGDSLVPGEERQHVKVNGCIVPITNRNEECKKRPEQCIEPSDNAVHVEINPRLTFTGSKTLNKADSFISTDSHSQQNAYLTPKAVQEFPTSVTNLSNRENSKSKPHSSNTKASKTNGILNQGSGSSHEIGQKTVVWYRGKPYGGGVIG